MPFNNFGSIPHTQGRTALSLIIRAYQTGDNYQPGINEDREAGRIVGAVTLFDRNEERTVIKRRSLGKRGMQPFQVIPQSVDIKLSLKRVALYREDFLKEVGNIEGSLLNQTEPLIFQEVQRTPTGSGDIFEYHDCWFTTNPMTYDVMSGDLLVMQNIEIAAAYMKPTLGTFAGIPIEALGTIPLLNEVFKF